MNLDRPDDQLPPVRDVSIIPATMYLVPNEEFSTLATSLWAAWSRRAGKPGLANSAENPKAREELGLSTAVRVGKGQQVPMIFGGNDPFSGVWKLHSAGIFSATGFLASGGSSRTNPAFSHDEPDIPVEDVNFLRSISSRSRR